MALGYLACDTVNQIGGAEHSGATQDNFQFVVLRDRD